MPPSVDPAAEPLIIDARGLRCPWPVLRAQRAMRQRREPFVLLADDPLAATDVPVMAQAGGWHAVVEQDGGAALRILLRPEEPKAAI